MNDKLGFLNKLGGLLELANQYQGRLTKEQVEEYFIDEQLTREQMELVFDYLMAQKVAVRGYVKLGNRNHDSQDDKVESVNQLTIEEQEYLEEYTQDLKAIRALNQGELAELIQKINSGDALAKGRLTEVFLTKVVEIGKSMHHSEVFLGDLIQEGNVALMLAIETLPDIEVSESEIDTEITTYIESEVKQGIQLLIEEMTELKNRDRKMVEQVQNLDESITKLTEDLGRKVTLDELAIYTEMSEDEILEILKLTGEDVEDAEPSTEYEVGEGDLPEEFK